MRLKNSLRKMASLLELHEGILTAYTSRLFSVFVWFRTPETGWATQESPLAEELKTFIMMSQFLVLLGS